MCTNEAILIEFIPSCNMQKRHLYSNQYFLAHKRLQNSSIFKHKFLKFSIFCKIYFCTYGIQTLENIVNKYHVWNNKRSLANIPFYLPTQKILHKIAMMYCKPSTEMEIFLVAVETGDFICVEYSNTQHSGGKNKAFSFLLITNFPNGSNNKKR